MGNAFNTISLTFAMKVVNVKFLFLNSDIFCKSDSCHCSEISGYPQEAAAHVALKTVRNFLEENPSLVRHYNIL